MCKYRGERRQPDGKEDWHVQLHQMHVYKLRMAER